MIHSMRGIQNKIENSNKST